MITKNGVNFVNGFLEGIKNPELEVYSLNPKTLKAEWTKVRVAARQPADPHYYRITTNTGREIEATGDHNFIISKNTELFNARADELKEGYYVPLPRRINSHESENITINLLDLLKDSGLYIKDNNQIIKKNYEKIKRLFPIDKNYDSYLNEFRKGRGIEISYFLKILHILNIAVNKSVLDNIVIVAKSGPNFIRPIFRFTNYFMRILGYLISEGHISIRLVAISNTDKEVISDVKKCLEKLGQTFIIQDKYIQISSRIFYHLITKLDIGRDSATKKIPDDVFGLSNSFIKEMLMAMFEGDGWFYNNTIGYCTKSKLLINQLAYILLRFEIFTTIKKKWKRATNSQHKGDYYWDIAITGENLFRFKENIGFISKRKNKLLDDFIASHPKKFNTNIDIIPDGKLMLKQIDEIINKEPKTPSTYESMYRKTGFSRQFIKNQIPVIEARISKLREVKQIIDSLANIPALNQVIIKGKEHRGFLWKHYHSAWQSLNTYKEKSKLRTFLKIQNGIYKTDYSDKKVINDIKKCYEILGVGITRIDRALSSSIYRSNTIKYNKFLKNLNYLKEYYSKIDFGRAYEILKKLEQFANSDILWDKIAKIEKIKCEDKFVYDLTVDNENFLCGFGGMFIHNSMTLKFFIDQENTIRGTNIIIIDPAASLGAAPEYKRMCEKKNGTYISFSKDSKNIPAIMGLHTGDFLEDVFAIEHVLSVMLGGEQGISKAQEPWLEKAILQAFEMVGISSDIPSSWKKEPPRLKHLHIALKKLFREAKSENARMSIEALLSRLSRFIDDGMYSFIDQTGTELRIDNSFTVFEFKNTPSQIKETLTAIVMNFVKAKAIGNTDKTIIVLEEAPLWLKHEVLADFLSTMLVLIRKSNTSMLLVLQDLGQLNNCKQGETLLGNLMFTYLMGCKKNLLSKTAATFNLNDKEQQLLLRSTTGEGILLWNKERFQVSIKIDPETYKLITTNPNDIQIYEQEEDKLREARILELLRDDLGFESGLAEGIDLLAQKIVDEKLSRIILAKYPVEIQSGIKTAVKKAKLKIKDTKTLRRNADYLLEFWLRKGRKNIMPKDNSIEISESIRIRAEKDYDIIRQAQKYYRIHTFNTKPIHLTKREEELYENVAKKMENSISKSQPRTTTKEMVVQDLRDKGKSKRDSQEKVSLLANSLWHEKSRLANDDIALLKSLGYQESNNNIFNFYGKLLTVLGKPIGNETLQHMTYKHLYKQNFSNSVLEYKDTLTGMETDAMVPLPNGKRIFVEIQSSPQKKHVIAAKISKLDETADYWIIACKKNDLKFYSNISSAKGQVCTFPQSVAVIHNLIKKNT